jgi:class 3 adenylate cyclase
MTQEELAARARISIRCLSDQERGVNHTPHRYTLDALIGALALSSSDEATLRAAARPTFGAAPGSSLDLASQPSPVWTVLIADIRGYTHYLVEKGNEPGAALAMRFAALAQLAVSSRGGQVVELRGDEVLAVFPSVSQAVHAAVDLQKQCQSEEDGEQSVPVGVGLDAGELIPVQGGVRGLAVNLAARLCAEAEVGEILASETVRHLAHKVNGLSYQDWGIVALKGFAEPVRAFQVVAEHAEIRPQSLTLSSHSRTGSGSELKSEHDQPQLVLAQVWSLLTLLLSRAGRSDVERASSSRSLGVE